MTKINNSSNFVPTNLLLSPYYYHKVVTLVSY